MSENVTHHFPRVSRVEVIDSTGRAFVRYYRIVGVSVQTQDDGRTIKIFANVPEEGEYAGSSHTRTAPDHPMGVERCRECGVAWPCEFADQTALSIAPPEPDEPHECEYLKPHGYAEGDCLIGGESCPTEIARRERVHDGGAWEYAVFYPRRSETEPHRDAMTLEAAQEWVRVAEEEDFRKGTFEVRGRRLGEWEAVPHE